MNEREPVELSVISGEQDRGEDQVNWSHLIYETERKLVLDQLRDRAGIEGLKAWRRLDRQGPAIGRVRRWCDRLAALDYLGQADPDKQRLAIGQLRENLFREQIGRIDELMMAMLAIRTGEELQSTRPEVIQITRDLSEAYSKAGEVDVIDILSSNRVSAAVKTAWFEANVAPAIKFLEDRDLAEAREAIKPPPPELLESKETIPNQLPPPDVDSFSPSMEELERAKEGESGAWFLIRPFYGGYWRGSSYDHWDGTNLKWVRMGRTLQPFDLKRSELTDRRVITGVVRGGTITALPLADGFVPDLNSFQIQDAGSTQLLADGQGGAVIDTHQIQGLKGFSVEVGRGQSGLVNSAPAGRLQIETGRLSDKTEQILTELETAGQPVLNKARRLKQFVRSTLTYSNNSAMNAVYRGGNPAEYFKRIETSKESDCDVANTYFAALLSRLKIPVQLVTGHYVNTKNRTGAAVLSAGTAHAWVEIWDGRRWHKLDATPPNDPNLDDEETDEADDSAFEGDWGEAEAPAISEEEFESLLRQAEHNLKEREQLPEEQRAQVFAEQAGCSTEEANRVLIEIESAREFRDRQGRKIRDRLVREFQKIVQNNLVERRRYEAPVRLTDGEFLDEPVEAHLDLRAGEANPTGFGRYIKKIKREQIYGGFDAVLLVDKSGSMRDADPTSELPKWQLQQRLTFLLFDALATAAAEFKRQRIRLISPLDVRFGLVSFQDQSAKVEQPLGGIWGPKEQLQVWRALQANIGGGTPDHLGLQAIQALIDEDKILKPKTSKGRLRLVLVSADGGSDNQALTIAAKEALKEKGVIVKAAGIGPAARTIQTAYYPDGTNLTGFEDLPDWAAEQVIANARLLFPRKVRQ